MDRGIVRFSEGVTDYRPIWPMVEDEFYAEEKAQFRSEGQEGGSKWQPISKGYADWKEAHYPGKPILQREGSLYNSLTSGSDPNAVKIETRKVLTLGSKVPYAIYHQSPDPRQKLPRRPEIRLTEDFKRTTMGHIQQYVLQVATQSGFRRGLTPTAASKLGSIFGKGISPRGTSPRRSTWGGLNF